MSFFPKQVRLQQQAIRQEQQSNAGVSSAIAQPSLTSAEQRVADFEKRMNYKCKGLTPEQQDIFEAKWQSASRLKRWPDES